MDGWNTEELSAIMDVISDIERLAYELRNCYKGAYTNCHTYDELKEYIERKAEQLKSAACECDYILDEDEE